MRNKLITAIKFFIGWPFSLLALIFIIKLILQKGQSIFPNVKEINFQILIYSIICFIFYFFLRTLLWRQILKYKGCHITFKETSFLWGYSEIKRYLPGNIWGVLGRAVSFSEKKINHKTIFSSLIIEAELVVLGAAIICSLFLPFIFENYLPVFWQSNILINLIRAVVLIIFVVYVFNSVFLLYKPFQRNPISNKFFRIIFSNFSAKENLNLIMLSILTLFIFGLGIYFSIASVAYLNPNYLFLYIGLFIFSFLAGYVSIITPTGLGVREAALVIGLSKSFTVANASVAAIFSRIIVILSELSFLLLAYIWKNIKDKSFLKMEAYARKNIHSVYLIIAIFVYIFLFTNLSFLRYDNYYTGRFDLGNMDQTVWNTSRGRIFQLTDPDGTAIISRLAYHADYVLILLAPFYIYWSDPRMLLLIQTIILALGSIFVYKLSEKILKSKNLSLVLSLGYLLNPSLQYSNLYDFHAVTIATTALLGAFYFLKANRYFLFIFFALIAALTKENVWLTISFFGIYIIFQNLYRYYKSRKINKTIIYKLIFGSAIFFICCAMFYYLVWIAIPMAKGGNHFALSYYSDFGNSPTQVVKNMLYHPLNTLSILIQNGRFEYLKQLFLPISFLPIFSLSTLLFIFPDLLINTLSNNGQLHQIYYQYTTIITPFLFIAAIFGLKNVKKYLPFITNSAIIVILTVSFIYSAHAFGPLPGSWKPNTMMLTNPLKNKKEVDYVISKIKKRYSIAATNNLGSHLSRRQEIYTIPLGLYKADVVAFLLNDPFAQPSLNAQKEMVVNLKKDLRYRVVYEKDDFIVFQKKLIQKK